MAVPPTAIPSLGDLTGLPILPACKTLTQKFLASPLKALASFQIVIDKYKPFTCFPGLPTSFKLSAIRYCYALKIYLESDIIMSYWCSGFLCFPQRNCLPKLGHRQHRMWQWWQLQYWVRQLWKGPRIWWSSKALSYLFLHASSPPPPIAMCGCRVNNTGSFNKGNVNLGNFNEASANNGNFNKGNANAGSYNTGSQNNGNSNSGNQNDGTGNSGNQNTVRLALTAVTRVSLKLVLKTKRWYIGLLLCKGYLLDNRLSLRQFSLPWGRTFCWEWKVQHPLCPSRNIIAWNVVQDWDECTGILQLWYR